MATVSTTEVTLTDDELVEAISELRRSGELMFQNKHNRDAVASHLKGYGLTARKGSTGYQQCDPRYTFEGRNLPNKGLANDYRHGFSNLYTLVKL